MKKRHLSAKVRKDEATRVLRIFFFGHRVSENA